MIKRLIYVCMTMVVVAGCVRAAKNMDIEMKLHISHYKVPCAGESVQLCYVVRKDNGEKEFFYDQIEGFDYQWGYNYTISVEKKIMKSAKADASVITYKLKKIIKKEKVLPGVEFELPVKFNDQVIVENDKGVCSYFREINIKTGKIACADLAKAESAVFRYDTAGLVLVKIK